MSSKDLEDNETSDKVDDNDLLKWRGIKEDEDKEEDKKEAKKDVEEEEV